MKKTIYTIILAIGIVSIPAHAVIAKRDVIKTISQPDGSTIQIKQQGDERFHFYTTLDGEPLLPDDKGTFKKVSHEQLKLVANERINLKNARKMQSRVEIDNDEVSSPSADASWKGVGLFGQMFPHDGEKNALVILVEYSDVSFSMEDPHDYFNRFLNEEGFSDNGAKGSSRDYFIAQSMGKFVPHFDVYGPVTLDARATYGGNDRYGDDKNAVGMVIDACKLLDDEINFADYDLDNDGYVDNVYIIYAGQGEATYGPAESIWPHQWSLREAGKSLRLDDKSINNYGCCNEVDRDKPAGIGTFTHEFGHVLGLPDLYSCNGGYIDMLATPDEWDIMDYGPYNDNGNTPPYYSVFERNAMGWIDLVEIKDGMNVTLEEIGSSNMGCVIPTDDPNEFFLLENRQKVGYDTYIPGHGLLIWHIKFDKLIWEYNQVNDKYNKQYVDIEEACGRADNSKKSVLEAYAFPGVTGNTVFSDSTTPNMLTWDNKPLCLVINNITETADGLITFEVTNPSGIISVVDDVDHDSQSELFTLQGVKAGQNPAPGIYIQRFGDSFKKVIIK